jgi:hypothetical protein
MSSPNLPDPNRIALANKDRKLASTDKQREGNAFN